MKRVDPVYIIMMLKGVRIDNTMLENRKGRKVGWLT